MRRSAYTDSQIIGFLREVEAGVSVATLCRTAKVSRRTFYRWRQTLGALEPAAALRMRALESENRRLRHVLDDLVRMAPAAPPLRPRPGPVRSDVGVEGPSRPTVIGRHPALRVSPYMR